MRKTQLLVASVPPAMMREVERLKKAEHRTRSELVREALRVYFALAKQFPEEKPTPAELRALTRVRRDMARGNYVTLDQLNRELDSPPIKGSRKIGSNARPRLTASGYEPPF